MSDYLVRIITMSGTIRALACVTTGLVAEACRRHSTRPTAAAALGRAVTCEFCRESYQFNREELVAVLAGVENGEQGETAS